MNALPDIAPAAEVFTVRAFQAGDLAFVRDSWLRSAWGAEKRRLQAEKVRSRAIGVAGAAWYGLHRPKVTQLVLGGGVTITVACERDDANRIGGWLAIGPERTVVYCYVKQAYRGFGLIRMLADAAGVEWKRA